MANIKFSQFTNQAAADTTYLVGYDGTDNTNYTKAQIKTWLTTGSNAIPTLYSADGTLASARTITMDGNTLSMAQASGNTVTFSSLNNEGISIAGGFNYKISTGDGTFTIDSSTSANANAIVFQTNSGAGTQASILIDSRSPGANADLHLKTATKLKIDLPVAATVGYVLKADDTAGNVSWAPETDTGVTGVTLAIGTGQTSPLAESIINRELTITSNKYGGTNQVGYVPEGGANTTFLRGDGTWVTPTDTNTNIANTDLNLDASRTLDLGADKNLTFTGSGTSKVTFSNSDGVEIARDLTVQKNVIIQGQGYSELNAMTANTFAPDWNIGNVQSVTLTQASTFAPTNPKAGATYILIVTNTTAAITWGSYIKWAAPDTQAAPPELSGSGKTDVITLICYDGSTTNGLYYGSITKDLS